jgi:hypothetical protein
MPASGGSSWLVGVADCGALRWWVATGNPLGWTAPALPSLVGEGAGQLTPSQDPIGPSVKVRAFVKAESVQRCQML